jgi:hypothetical protein
MADVQGAPPPFDYEALTAQLRKGDQTAIAQAYKTIFDSELGRFVLAHHLLECGVGRRYGNEASDAQLRYARGMEDAALDLAELAGFDPAMHAVAVLHYPLKGPPDDLPSDEPAILDDPAWSPAPDDVF